jgi:N-sulfoglucosamine sulfohydrolase
MMKNYGLIIVALALLSQLTSVAGGAEKPNFVVFITDDQNVLDAAPYGSDLRTPHMTRLAADGMIFNRAYVASPACGPSRTAMLTGMWPARNGAERNHQAPRADIKSLIPVLKSLGYETAAFGKVAHSDWAKHHHFDFVIDSKKTASNTRAVAEYLAGRDRSKPLCLFFGTHYPHAPWGDNDGYDPSKLRLPPTQVDTVETRSERAKYSTDVTKSDTLLGEVRALVRENLPGDTLTLFTSDNGGQWPFGKWNLYEAGIHIPLIVSWPGHIPPATSTDAMVSWPDMIPTFIELAGGTVPEGLDGKSYAAVLRGTATTHRDRIFAAHSGDGEFNVYPMRSVQTSRWKYIRNLHPEFQHHTHVSRATSKNGIVYWRTWLAAAESDPSAAAIVKRYSERPQEELYDLQSDPFELHNLANDQEQAERLNSMRTELTAWMKEQGDQETVYGKPLLIGEAVTLIGGGKKKQPADPE